jgi:hypothetical protein
MEHRPEEYPFCIVNATVEENASINKHAQRLPCKRLRSNAAGDIHGNAVSCRLARGLQRGYVDAGRRSAFWWT